MNEGSFALCFDVVTYRTTHKDSFSAGPGTVSMITPGLNFDFSGFSSKGKSTQTISPTLYNLLGKILRISSRTPLSLYLLVAEVE